MKSFLLAFSVLIASIASHVSAAPVADSTATDSAMTIENMAIYLDDDVDFISPMPSDNSISIDLPFNWLRLAGLVVPFASAIAIIWLLLAYRDRRQRNRLHVIEMSIIHKQPLPDSFFQSAGMDPQRRMLTGFYWLGAGFAIILFFAITFASMWPVGLFPMFIGIGRIVVSVLSRSDAFGSSNTGNDGKATVDDNDSNIA